VEKGKGGSRDDVGMMYCSGGGKGEGAEGGEVGMM